MQGKTRQLTRQCCRFIGVSDLAAVRFSLPAQLLEPRPNLGMCLSPAAGGWLREKTGTDGEQSTGTIWTGPTHSSGQSLSTDARGGCRR
jgi:hypothetical protein